MWIKLYKVGSHYSCFKYKSNINVNASGFIYLFLFYALKVLELCLQVLLTVNLSFPRQVEVSPLENAISVVENKNQELRTLISQYQHKQLHGNINLLSMCLNGVIDAAVNGGIARYQEVRNPAKHALLMPAVIKQPCFCHISKPYN